MAIEVAASGSDGGGGFVWVSGCGGIAVVPIRRTATHGRVGLDLDCGRDVLFAVAFQPRPGVLHPCDLNDFYTTPGIETHTVYVDLTPTRCDALVLSDSEIRRARILGVPPESVDLADASSPTQAP
jgi:hypothetical protein